jgi:hypothetical protein
MGFFKDFKLSKALESAFDIGKDFVLGEVTKSGVYDTATGKYIDTSSRPKDGGFLGFIGKAATAYTAMQDSDEEELFQMPEHEGYTAKRGYRQRQASLSTQRYTPTNRMYQDAIVRRMKQVNFEKNLQRMTESTTVRPTSRRGSPVSAGTTTITRQTGAPSARPAKTTAT